MVFDRQPWCRSHFFEEVDARQAARDEDQTAAATSTRSDRQ